GHKNTLITRIVGRLRETGIIDIVGCPPGEICRVGAGLQNIMLKIVLVDQHNTFPLCTIRKMFTTVPVPVLIFRKAILANSTPGRTFSASGKRLFVKRGPDIPIHASNPLVIVAPPVVPKSVIMIQGRNIILVKNSHYLFQAIGKSISIMTWHITRYVRRRFLGCKWTHSAPPPAYPFSFAR